MSMMRIELEGLSSELHQDLESWQEKAADALTRLKEKRCRGSEWTGWYHWPRQGGFPLATKIRDFARNYPLAYEVIVVVGIGGSYAGCKAVDEALRHSYQGMLATTSVLVATPIFSPPLTSVKFALSTPSGITKLGKASLILDTMLGVGRGVFEILMFLFLNIQKLSQSVDMCSEPYDPSQYRQQI